MVRCAERPCARQAAPFEQAGNRLDLRHFQQFARRKRRQQARQALGQHGLARPRWPAEQEIVAACRCDFEHALGPFLAFDVAHVRPGRGGGKGAGWGWADDGASGEVVDEGNEAGRRKHASARPRGLCPAGCRADQLQVHRFRRHRCRQHAKRFAKPPVERQFADGGMAFQQV